MLNKHFISGVITILIPCLISCGGGGGGEDFIGAAEVAIDANPSEIDLGDHSKVTVHINDVHPNGIMLKIRFVNGINYLNNTANLEVDGNDIDVGPTVNKISGNLRYVVFFFAKNLFGDNSGKLTFEVEGATTVVDGEAEVDADVDNPNVKNNVEFDIDNPEFEVEDSTDLSVNG